MMGWLFLVGVAWSAEWEEACSLERTCRASVEERSLEDAVEECAKELKGINVNAPDRLSCCATITEADAALSITLPEQGEAASASPPTKLIDVWVNLPGGELSDTPSISISPGADLRNGDQVMFIRSLALCGDPNQTTHISGLNLDIQGLNAGAPAAGEPTSFVYLQDMVLEDATLSITGADGGVDPSFAMQDVALYGSTAAAPLLTTDGAATVELVRSAFCSVSEEAQAPLVRLSPGSGEVTPAHRVALANNVFLNSPGAALSLSYPDLREDTGQADDTGLAEYEGPSVLVQNSFFGNAEGALDAASRIPINAAVYNNLSAWGLGSEQGAAGFTTVEAVTFHDAALSTGQRAPDFDCEALLADWPQAHGGHQLVPAALSPHTGAGDRHHSLDLDRASVSGQPDDSDGTIDHGDDCRPDDQATSCQPDRGAFGGPLAPSSLWSDNEDLDCLEDARDCDDACWFRSFEAYPDQDGDGYAAAETECVYKNHGELELGDCDDGDNTVHPDAAEFCDRDYDCDGSSDDADVLPTWSYIEERAEGDCWTDQKVQCPAPGDDDRWVRQEDRPELQECSDETADDTGRDDNPRDDNPAELFVPAPACGGWVEASGEGQQCAHTKRPSLLALLLLPLLVLRRREEA